MKLLLCRFRSATNTVYVSRHHIFHLCHAHRHHKRTTLLVGWFVSARFSFVFLRQNNNSLKIYLNTFIIMEIIFWFFGHLPQPRTHTQYTLTRSIHNFLFTLMMCNHIEVMLIWPNFHPTVFPICFKQQRKNVSFVMNKTYNGDDDTIALRHESIHWNDGNGIFNNNKNNEKTREKIAHENDSLCVMWR